MFWGWEFSYFSYTIKHPILKQDKGLNEINMHANRCEQQDDHSNTYTLL